MNSKIFRHSDKLFRFNGLIPLLAVLTVNNKCDSNCPYCFVNKKAEFNIPINKLKKVIDELADMGCYELTIQGGEALLRNDIGDIFEYIKSRDLRLHLVTNGKLIYKRMEEIKMLDAVHVSLDGDKEFNALAKGDDAYYDLAVNGIKILKENNINTSIITLLLDGITHQLEFLFNFAKNNDVGIQFLTNFSVSDGLGGGKNMVISEHEFEVALKMILKAKKNGFPVLPSLRALTYALEWKKRHKVPYSQVRIEKKDNKLRKKCHAGRKFIFIDYEGFLSPCCIYQMKKGNVYEIGVAEAMKTISDSNQCSECNNLPFIDMNSIFNFEIHSLKNYFFKILCHR